MSDDEGELEAKRQEWFALANAAMPNLSPAALPDLITECLASATTEDVNRLVSRLNTDEGFNALLAGVNRVRDMYMRIQAIGIGIGVELDGPRADGE